MYLGMEGWLGGGPLLPVWLEVECVQGCVNMGVCVIVIYVYGADGVVVLGCSVGSVVCEWWGIFPAVSGYARVVLSGMWYVIVQLWG